MVCAYLQQTARALKTLSGVSMAACMVLAQAVAQPGAASAPVSAGAASLAFSEQFLFRSEEIGQTFLIQVARPLQLVASDRKSPVIYVTDGLVSFGLYTSATRALSLEELIPPAYVVAIGYPEVDTVATSTLRLRDLMHRRTLHRTGMAGGGGGAFADFLLKQVKPFIESRYPVDAARSILAGHSLGGLFAANVLAWHPEMFAGYVIGSPSVHYDDELLAAVRTVAARGGGRRVFIGVGALEPAMVPRADALEQALSGSQFVVARTTFANETHTSVLGALASAGLRFVLGPPIGPVAR